jgi:hypothetical protein
MESYADIKALREEIDELTADNQRLKAALEPFAKRGNEMVASGNCKADDPEVWASIVFYDLPAQEANDDTQKAD